MIFKELSLIFKKLESTSKRIEKILILRDFLEQNPKDGPIIFDIIGGNLQRELDNKKIAISLKTIFQVLSFISQNQSYKIEKEFNKIGDIGEVSQKFMSGKIQKTLQSQKLTINKIINSIKEISQIEGTNSNKYKKEILTNLFLSTQNDVEHRFLSRLLINDLRIGVSIGVLKEAMVNAYFPKIIDIHKICPNCFYINLNLKNCLKCNTELTKTNQEELGSKKFELVELDTPQNTKGLNKYVNYELNPIEYALRRNKNKYILKSQKPREVYNKFLNTFEQKYNLINSFEKLTQELNEDFTNINKLNIKLGTPIKSMLGQRASSIQESFEITSNNTIIDFKYDGLRAQIHNNKGEVHIFTRNLENITKQFPEVVEFIKTNFSDISFVIDTECVGFDYKNQKFLPFQTLSKRILTKKIDEVNHINVIVRAFDILYLNGETILSQKYKTRRKILEELMLNRKLRQKIHFNAQKLKNI